MALEVEARVEDVVGFMTNYGDLQLEIATKGSEPRVYEFSSRMKMQEFVRFFVKAKALVETLQRQLKYQKHITKAPWLKETTAEEAGRMKAAESKGAVVFKALVAGVGISPYKYLVLPRGESRLIIASRAFAVEENIGFDDIVSISGRFSSFTPTILNCRRGAYPRTLELVLPSLRDSLWLRSQFYGFRAPHMLLSSADHTLKTVPLPVFLITFNMNRQTLQVPMEKLFQKAKGRRLVAVCLQEVPLLKRGGVFKAVEGYFAAWDLILVGMHAMWEMALFVFVAKELNPHVARVEKKELTAGFLGVVGNKGGLLVAFELMETRIAVLGLHLKHGQKSVSDRTNTLWKIFKSLRFGFEGVEMQLEADHCFLLGDTNYRIDNRFELVAQEAEKDNVKFLLKLDQLTAEKSAGRILCDFQVFLLRVTPHDRRARSPFGRPTSSTRTLKNILGTHRSVPATLTGSSTILPPPPCRGRSPSTPATLWSPAGIVFRVKNLLVATIDPCTHLLTLSFCATMWSRHKPGPR